MEILFNGLARHRPFGPENDYSIAYYAPQPRAVLRVVNSKVEPVEYDQWGQGRTDYLNQGIFMPKFLERDEAIRRKPWSEALWDGAETVLLVQWKKLWRSLLVIMKTIPHLPALRLGEPYQSLNHSEVIDYRDDTIRRATLSQVNPVLFEEI